MQLFRIGKYGLRVLALSLAAALALAPAFSVSGEPTGEVEQPEVEVQPPIEETIEGAVIIENSNFRFTADPKTGNFYINDLRNGMRWCSNPIDATDDKIASGVYRTNLRSQLIVEYTDVNRTKTKINSYAGAAARKTITFTKSGDSIRAEYNFERQEFTIPVRYTLGDDGFKAEILVSEIKSEGKNQINTIELLPYFGAGEMTEDGYIFIPDGSGAVIEFNNGKTTVQPYLKPLYGGDRTLLDRTHTSRDQTILFPVFGLAKETAAFLAIIEQGDSNAKLSANVAGNGTSYNAVSSVFTYRESELRPVRDQTNEKSTILFNALDVTQLKLYTVNYHLLQDPGLAAMAQTYRSYLQKQLGLQAKTDGKARLYLDIYGGILRAKQFLGFRYDGFQQLTTYDQAAAILKDLSAGGVTNMVVGYRQFNNDSIRGKIQANLDPAGELGGRGAYEELCKVAASLSADIYPEGDFIRFEKSGLSYSSLFTAVMGTNLSVAKQHPFSINMGMIDEYRAPWYYVLPESYDNAINTLKTSLGKLPSQGVYLTKAANLLYSDFSRGGLQKDQTVGQLQKAYAALAENEGLLMSAPNAYALAYAQRVTDLPVESGAHLLFDRDVPFAQMVLRGLVDFSGESVNITGMNRAALLRHVEAGSNVKFEVMASEAAVLADTKADTLFGANYDNCKAAIKEWNAELAPVLNAIAGATVRDYTSVGELKRISYTNGVTVYVNYANQAVTAADGTEVGAQAFVVKGGRS